MIFCVRQLPSVLVTTVLLTLGLVNEVCQLPSMAENDEDVVEYCIARLKNLL